MAIPVNALALSGNDLFVGTGDGRLVVFDVSTPASPQQIASLTMPSPNTVRLSGNLLLVAAPSELLIFNVSQPSAPVLLSQFQPTGGSLGTLPVFDVAAIGTAVMLAAGNGGIVTVDISNPSNPQQLFQQQLPFLNAFPAPNTEQGILPAVSLASQNGLVYVGTAAGIVFSYDATVPAVPRLMMLNVVGSDDEEAVSAITPGTNNLYMAAGGVTVQLDNTVPQNSIELYYPPPALSEGYAIGDAASRSSHPALNAITDSMRTRSIIYLHPPDRFGVARSGNGKIRSGKNHGKASETLSR